MSLLLVGAGTSGPAAPVVCERALSYEAGSTVTVGSVSIVLVYKMLRYPSVLYTVGHVPRGGENGIWTTHSWLAYVRSVTRRRPEIILWG